MRNRLKVLRAERNWSQADLADKLDVSLLLTQPGGTLVQLLGESLERLAQLRRHRHAQ